MTSYTEITQERVANILEAIAKKPLTKEALMKKFRIDAYRLENDLEIIKERGFTIGLDVEGKYFIESYQRKS